MSRFKGWTERTALEQRLDNAEQTKPAKYRNRRTEVDGILFDSKLEAEHYKGLAIAQRCGLLTFERQVNYPLIVNGQKITTYRADFVVTFHTGRVEVRDCKGYRTKEYRIKKKLMLALHGIEIVEIEKQ